MEVLIIICTAVIIVFENHTQNQISKLAVLMGNILRDADENAERRHKELLAILKNRTQG